MGLRQLSVRRLNLEAVNAVELFLLTPAVKLDCNRARDMYQGNVYQGNVYQGRIFPPRWAENNLKAIKPSSQSDARSCVSLRNA